MHHEHERDYERDETMRRDDDWYDERRYGRSSGSRQGYGREGMPGAGGPYGEGYGEPGYERAWGYDRPRPERRRYDRGRGYGGGEPYGGNERYGANEPYTVPGRYEREYGRDPEAPNEAPRRPYGEGEYVQYDRLAPAVRRRGGVGRASEGYGSSSRGYGAGQYSGRGPKGYKRSSERILEDVAERLTRDPDVDASEIEVAVDNDVVVLRGKVYDRGQKRAAEDVAETVSGVRDVRNELDVEKGMLQELTDAVTGRPDEHDEGNMHAAPRRAGVS
jgi:ribosomal protein L18E